MLGFRLQKIKKISRPKVLGVVFSFVLILVCLNAKLEAQKQDRPKATVELRVSANGNVLNSEQPYRLKLKEVIQLKVEVVKAVENIEDVTKNPRTFYFTLTP